VLWRKARDDVAEVGLVELRIFADLAGEEAFTKRTERNEPDAEFLECRYYFRFRLSPPKRIFALKCRDRLNGVCTTDGLHACFRESEMFHLALLNQILHGSGDVFDRHVGIDAVLIQQVDDIGLEALERGLGDLLDAFWTTVQAGLFAGVRIKLESELG